MLFLDTPSRPPRIPAADQSRRELQPSSFLLILLLLCIPYPGCFAPAHPVLTPNMSSIPPQPGGPPSQPVRTVRKIQSHQTLSSSNNAANARPSHHRAPRLSAGHEDLSRPPQLAPAPRIRPHRRARSNSDAASHEPVVSQAQKRPARKTGSGFGVKRSVLESLLRDGPQNANVLEALQELRYLVLSTRVDADADGMVYVIAPP